MAKKTSSKGKKRANKPKSTTIVHRSARERYVENALVENFIGLQKVMVNLSSKFDNLAGQIAKLLELFEISAKALAKSEGSPENNPETKEIIEKLDTLSAQAGLIGKGLALIHEIGTEKGRPMIPFSTQTNKPQISPLPSATPDFTNKEPSEEAGKELEGFEKSLPTKEKD